MNDHRIDIAEYARDLAQTVDDLVSFASDNADSEAIARVTVGYSNDEIGEPADFVAQFVDEWVLDVEHFRSTTNSDSVITHVLLVCGGPTVQVTIRPDDSAELFHSWGTKLNPLFKGAQPAECTTWEMPDGFGEQLRQLVGPWE